ncbi:metal-nicotianamine transporter YSL3-like protein [Tanacetum coccineum]
MYLTSRKKPKTNDNDQPQDGSELNEVFLRESIPFWLAATGYIVFSIVSIIVIPLMFPELKRYYFLVAYVIAPSLGFCNAYGVGLTDMNMSYNYGKVALFVLSAMSGKHDGVIAGLVGCGLIKSIVSISSDLMHDFKTAHLTLTSPRSMLVSQAIGTAIGFVVAPLTFFLFYKAFDIGNLDGEVNIKLLMHLSTETWRFCESKVSLHCLIIVYSCATYSLVLHWWQICSISKKPALVPAVASGLICGDGLLILPSSILALAGINPPIYMNFVP